MESWLREVLVSGLAGGLAGGAFAALALLAYAFLMPRLKCPECGEIFPRFRRPANWRQRLCGGGICAKCGCEVDRRGRKIQSR